MRLKSKTPCFCLTFVFLELIQLFFKKRRRVFWTNVHRKTFLLKTRQIMCYLWGVFEENFFRFHKIRKFSRIIPIKKSKFLIQQKRIKNILANFSRKNRQKHLSFFKLILSFLRHENQKFCFCIFLKKCYSFKKFIILISYNFTLWIPKNFSNLLIQKRKVNWIH